MLKAKTTASILLFASTTVCLGASSMTTTRKISEDRRCSTWKILDTGLALDGVTVQLGNTVRVCYRNTNNIHRFETYNSTFHTSDGQKEAIVAFAASKSTKKENCIPKISRYKYSVTENVQPDTKPEGRDLVATGRGMSAKGINQVCAKLFVRDPN